MDEYRDHYSEENGLKDLKWLLQPKDADGGGGGLCKEDSKYKIAKQLNELRSRLMENGEFVNYRMLALLALGHNGGMACGISKSSLHHVFEDAKRVCHIQLHLAIGLNEKYAKDYVKTPRDLGTSPDGNIKWYRPNGGRASAPKKKTKAGSRSRSRSGSSTSTSASSTTRRCSSSRSSSSYRHSVAKRSVTESPAVSPGRASPKRPRKAAAIASGASTPSKDKQHKERQDSSSSSSSPSSSSSSSSSSSFVTPTALQAKKSPFALLTELEILLNAEGFNPSEKGLSLRRVRDIEIKLHGMEQNGAIFPRVESAAVLCGIGLYL